MKKSYLSIIIPAYNSAKTLPRLLDSIFASNFSDFEVILVDDGSTDETKKVVKDYGLRYFFIKNSGPARARDFGSRKAKGEILVFFDSDVIVFPHTLKRIKKIFANKDVKAVTGFWDKKQKTKDFFPRYKALREWVYWMKEDIGKYNYLFSTRVAAIRKKVYWEVGGFVGEGKGIDELEDVEFSYRLTKKYPIVFDPKVMVHHEFDTFGKFMKKYFRRSFKWTKLFLRYRKLNRTSFTPNEITIGALAVLVLIFFFLGVLWRPFWVLAFVSFFIHVILERKFLTFVYKEEGLMFTIKAVLAGLVVYPAVYAGAGCSLIDSGFRLFGKVRKENLR